MDRGFPERFNNCGDNLSWVTTVRLVDSIDIAILFDRLASTLTCRIGVCNEPILDPTLALEDLRISLLKGGVYGKLVQLAESKGKLRGSVKTRTFNAL